MKSISKKGEHSGIKSRRSDHRYNAPFLIPFPIWGLPADGITAGMQSSGIIRVQAIALIDQIVGAVFTLPELKPLTHLTIIGPCFQKRTTLRSSYRSIMGILQQELILHIHQFVGTIAY